jgi:hypothetical protein
MSARASTHPLVGLALLFASATACSSGSQGATSSSSSSTPPEADFFTDASSIPAALRASTTGEIRLLRVAIQANAADILFTVDGGPLQHCFLSPAAKACMTKPAKQSGPLDDLLFDIDDAHFQDVPAAVERTPTGDSRETVQQIVIERRARQDPVRMNLKNREGKPAD